MPAQITVNDEERQFLINNKWGNNPIYTFYYSATKLEGKQNNRYCTHW